MRIILYILLCLLGTVLSGASENDGSFWWKNQEGFGQEYDNGMKGLAKLLLSEGVTSENRAIRNELIGMVISSYHVCQNGMEEAAKKINLILDLPASDELRDDYDYGDLNEAELDTLNDGLPSMISIQDLETDTLEDFTDVFEANEQSLTKQPQYVTDLERILRAIEHACASLSSTLPNIHSRKPRSPQNIARRVAISLKKWTERWLNSLENKFSTFMTHCIDDIDCKKYLEKVIKTLASELEKNEHMGYSPPDLAEIFDHISGKGMTSIGSLNQLQRAMFNMGNSVDGMDEEEESSFRMAEKISFPNDPNFLFIQDENLRKEFGIFSKLFKHGSRGFGLKKDSADLASEVEIETKEVVRMVPSTFLSFAFGSSLIQENWKAVKTRLSTFMKLASALSPATLRVGGSAANFLTYDPSFTEYEYEDLQYLTNVVLDPNRQTVSNSHHPKLRNQKMPHYEDNLVIKTLLPASSNHPKGKITQYKLTARHTDAQDYVDSNNIDDDHKINKDRCEPQLGKDFENFTMTGSDWKFLVDLTDTLNWTLLFDLNQFRRDAAGNWDPSNARLLFDDPLSSKIPIVWQLGNEPNAYHHKFKWNISPEQAAADYKVLRRELNSRFSDNDLMHSPTVVGPDVTRPRHTNDDDLLTEDSMEFLERFLRAGKEEIDAVTWHQYYLDGRTATLENFLSPAMLNVFPKQLQKIISLRNEEAKGDPVWLTETASAWGGGAPGLSDRFAAGFPWLDKLGAAALGGVDQVFRQTLYGGCYSLLDKNLIPYPDFWVTYIYKRLVGEGVLLPRTRLAPEAIRIYAHCLNSNHIMFKKGAIVVFGINLSNETKHMNIYGNSFKTTPKFVYKLTPPNGNLKSRDILLNGHILRLKEGGSLPVITPIEDLSEDLSFAPWSMDFWVFPEAAAAAC